MTDELAGFITKAGTHFHDKEQYRTIYPQALLDTLASELEITTPKARACFENAVLEIAGIYEMVKYSQIGKVPRHKENAALKKIEKKAGELEAAIIGMLTLGPVPLGRFSQGIVFAKKDKLPVSSAKFQTVLQLIQGSKAGSEDIQSFINPGLIVEFVHFVADVAAAALRDESIMHTVTPNTPVWFWLMTFRRCWNEFTDLPFTLGRYNTGLGGYENRTLFVFEELMKPLDPKVTRKQIESSFRKLLSKS